MAANDGKTVEDARRANLAKPSGTTLLNGLEIDYVRFAAAADALGADKFDVLSIRGYRNAKGEMVADYDSVRIEKRNNDAGNTDD